MLYMPIVVPFYESNGLMMKDIMILQAVYSIAIVILEVPSGYLADVWGRKKTLLLGAIMGVIGFATYGVSHGFCRISYRRDNSGDWSKLRIGS